MYYKNYCSVIQIHILSPEISCIQEYYHQSPVEQTGDQHCYYTLQFKVQANNAFYFKESSYNYISHKQTYLGELLNLELNRRGCHLHWCPFWSNWGRLHLLFEFSNLILYRPDSAPLPTQIPSPQGIEEQTSHHNGVYECKCPSLQYSKLSTDSKCILLNHIDTRKSEFKPKSKKQALEIWYWCLTCLWVKKERYCECCERKRSWFKIMDDIMWEALWVGCWIFGDIQFCGFAVGNWQFGLVWFLRKNWEFQEAECGSHAVSVSTLSWAEIEGLTFFNKR